jgi:hypothetical protein
MWYKGFMAVTLLGCDTVQSGTYHTRTLCRNQNDHNFTYKVLRRRPTWLSLVLLSTWVTAVSRYNRRAYCSYCTAFTCISKWRKLSCCLLLCAPIENSVYYFFYFDEWMMNWEVSVSTWSWTRAILACLESLRKTARNLSEDSYCPDHIHTGHLTTASL